MIDKQKLQVLLEVLQRAPCGLAERMICQDVVDQLIALAEPPAPSDRMNGAQTEPASYADRVTG